MIQECMRRVQPLHKRARAPSVHSDGMGLIKKRLEVQNLLASRLDQKECQNKERSETGDNNYQWLEYMRSRTACSLTVIPTLLFTHQNIVVEPSGHSRPRVYLFKLLGERLMCQLPAWGQTATIRMRDQNPCTVPHISNWYTTIFIWQHLYNMQYIMYVGL